MASGYSYIFSVCGLMCVNFLKAALLSWIVLSSRVPSSAWKASTRAMHCRLGVAPVARAAAAAASSAALVVSNLSIA